MRTRKHKECTATGFHRRVGAALMAGVALSMATVAGHLWAEEANLARNPSFEQLDGEGKPIGYELSGGAVFLKSLSNPRTEAIVRGIALGSTAAGSGNGWPFGMSASQTIPIDSGQGRSFCFRFRGLPQDDFTVAEDGLYMKAEFFGNGGQTAYDGKIKQLFPLVQQARRDLAVNGNGHVGGAAVWRDYTLNFYVPFPQVDRMKLTVGCKGSVAAPASGSGSSQPGGGRRAGSLEWEREAPIKRLDTSGRAFFVSDFSLTRLPEPAQPPRDAATALSAPPVAGPLLPLGGRWHYAAKPGETRAPALFDHTNAERLLYRDGPPDGPCQMPFAGNMSAALRAGNEDLAGNAVTAGRPVADNVTVRFEAGSMILHTHGLPNHPTGRFPEDGFGPGSNPNSIQEQDETFYLPLDPKPNPNHFSVNGDNSNRALNMGPIGVAVNGVVFFNPFDADRIDGSDKMDRCCGHPNQDGMYHYHKYPICLNSPWTDEGKAHSPLLGWAFDGLPVYGPYESANVMAKDVTGPAALNAFNGHYDPQRGWHYHVTPGKFPYIIGGYWGQLDRRNVHPPRGRGPGPMGGPFPGPNGGPPPW